jgi:hypothetical protein
MQECGICVNLHQLIRHQKHPMPHSYWLLTQFTVLTRGSMKIAVWERPEIMTFRRNRQWIYETNDKFRLSKNNKQTQTKTNFRARMCTRG